MKFLVGMLALTVVVAAISSMGGSSDDASGGGPGSPAVYDRIDSLTDCSALQAEFDQADANHERELGSGDIAMAKVTTSYMSAADDRMEEVGCYG